MYTDFNHIYALRNLHTDEEKLAFLADFTGIHDNSDKPVSVKLHDLEERYRSHLGTGD